MEELIMTTAERLVAWIDVLKTFFKRLKQPSRRVLRELREYDRAMRN